MDAVLDLPVVAGGLQQPLRRDLRAHDAVSDGPLLFALPLADRLDPADGLEARPIMQILQPADIVRDRRDARLEAPVPGADMPVCKRPLNNPALGDFRAG